MGDKKIEKIYNANGYKVIHVVPDISEEERDKIKTQILLKLYNQFSNKTNYDENVEISKCDGVCGN
jgi:hypothetical protein